MKAQEQFHLTWNSFRFNLKNLFISLSLSFLHQLMTKTQALRLHSTSSQYNGKDRWKTAYCNISVMSDIKKEEQVINKQHTRKWAHHSFGNWGCLANISSNLIYVKSETWRL